MFKKLSLLLAVSLHVQESKACTQAEIDAAAPFGCSCNAAAACAGAFIGGAAAVTIINKLTGKLFEVPADPKRIPLVGYLACRGGGMKHCENWDWNPNSPGGKCGLQSCNVYTLNATRIYNAHDGDLFAAAKEAADTSKPIRTID